jgi:predicted DNA-binding transcriptional regulator YafY
VARSARLYGIVEELRAAAPRPLSRRQLAEHFEVSERTIERDVGHLLQAGSPIWAMRGRNGGYAIKPEATLPPLNMTAGEALAIVAALEAMPSMPFAASARSAQLKVLAAMPSEEAAFVRRLAARVRVSARYHGADATVLAMVEKAVVDRRVVEIATSHRDGPLRWETLEAQGLHIGTTATFLLGWSRTADAPAAARLDEIVEISATGEVADERPLEPLLAWVDSHRPPVIASNREPIEICDEEDEMTITDDDTAMATSEDVRRIALALPEVREDPHFGRPSLRFRGKVVAVLKPDERMFIRATPDEQQSLASERPEVFTIDDGLQVRIGGLTVREVRELVHDAWRLVAPKRLVAELDRSCDQ